MKGKKAFYAVVVAIVALLGFIVWYMLNNSQRWERCQTIFTRCEVKNKEGRREREKLISRLEKKLKLNSTRKLDYSEIFDFPSASIENSYVAYSPRMSNRRCQVVEKKKKWNILEIGKRDWGVLARALNSSISYAVTTGDCDHCGAFNAVRPTNDYRWQVKVIEDFPFYFYVKGDHVLSVLSDSDWYSWCDYGKRLRTFFKGVVENEKKLRQLGKLIPYANTFFDYTTRLILWRWSLDFWEASYHDMEVLEKKVSKRDKKIEKSGYSVRNYLYDYALKREGWFMRRWMAAGRGQRGDDLLVCYRFWIWRLAHELEFPLAVWRSKLQSEIAGTKTLRYRSWYLSSLAGKSDSGKPSPRGIPDQAKVKDKPSSIRARQVPSRRRIIPKRPGQY